MSLSVSVTYTETHTPGPSSPLFSSYTEARAVSLGLRGSVAGPAMIPVWTETQFTALAAFILWSREALKTKGENQIYLLRLNFSISGIWSFGVISSHLGVPAPHSPAWSKSGGSLGHGMSVYVCVRENGVGETEYGRTPKSLIVGVSD